MKPFAYFLLSCLLVGPELVRAQEDVRLEPQVFKEASEPASWTFSGEVTAYGVGASGDNDYNLFGARYLPRFTFESPVKANLTFDAEVQAHVYGWQQSYGSGETQDDLGLEAHRLWGRFYTDQAGLRVGLQEIRFGHSKLLRSMQWFDTYDYRDPTGFTQGVRATLARWYAEDSSNLWVWYLQADPEVYYGQQMFQSYGGHPEWGGRYQWPAGSGELALTLHRRAVDLGSQIDQPGAKELATENRLAFDVQQDWGVGFWFEFVYNQRSEGEDIFTREQRPTSDSLFTLGLDYTFAGLDGLYALAEWQVRSEGGGEGQGDDDDEGGFGFGEDADSNLALSASLPLGVSDQLRVMTLSYAASNATYAQLDWTHSTDNWVYGLVGFSQTSDLGDASGAQLLVQYNH